MDPGIGRHGCQAILDRKRFEDLDPAGAEFLRQRTHRSPACRGRSAEFVIDDQDTPPQFGSSDLDHGTSPSPREIMRRAYASDSVRRARG